MQGPPTDIACRPFKLSTPVLRQRRRVDYRH
jgi:hypothetical protein